MKRKIRTTLIVLLLAMAAVAPGYAQKVYKEGGAVILDFGPGSGFPQEAVETVKGKKTAAGTPSNSTGPMTDNSESGTINATVYRKLEIAPADESSPIAWAAAYTLCQTSRGAGWRLPTQRELQAIYIFMPAIESLLGGSGNFRANTEYWSATEDENSSSAWDWHTENGIASLYKSSSGYVRCVREL